MNGLYKIVAVVLLSLGLIGGCGGSGGGEGCDFDFDAFLNGVNANQATSQWDCVGSKPGEIVPDFVFQAFEDGTGFSTSDVGIFTFQQTGCRSLNYQSGAGNATISNIQGSIDSGVLTFFQTSSTPELDDISSGCILVIF